MGDGAGPSTFTFPDSTSGVDRRNPSSRRAISCNFSSSGPSILTAASRPNGGYPSSRRAAISSWKNPS